MNENDVRGKEKENLKNQKPESPSVLHPNTLLRSKELPKGSMLRSTTKELSGPFDIFHIKIFVRVAERHNAEKHQLY